MTNSSNQSETTRYLRFISCLWDLQKAGVLSDADVGRVVLAGASNVARSGVQNPSLLRMSLLNMNDVLGSMLKGNSSGLLQQVRRDIGLDSQLRNAEISAR